VVFLTLTIQKLWNAGVRGAEFIHQRVLDQQGSHTEATGEGESEDVSKGGIAEEPARSFVERPVSLKHAERLHQAPSSSQPGNRNPSVAKSPSGDMNQAPRQINDVINQQPVRIKFL
jgi:hypothetical protein